MSDDNMTDPGDPNGAERWEAMQEATREYVELSARANAAMSLDDFTVAEMQLLDERWLAMCEVLDDDPDADGAFEHYVIVSQELKADLAANSDRYAEEYEADRIALAAKEEIAEREDLQARVEITRYKNLATLGQLAYLDLDNHECKRLWRNHKSGAIFVCSVCGDISADHDGEDGDLYPDIDYRYLQSQWKDLQEAAVPTVANRARPKGGSLPKGKKTRARTWEALHAAATAQDNAYWQELRKRVFERDRHTCQGCLDPTAEGLNCHHLTYRNLGCELAYQLISLCDDCHKKVHFRGEYKTRKPKCYDPDRLPKWSY